MKREVQVDINIVARRHQQKSDENIEQEIDVREEPEQRVAECTIKQAWVYRRKYAKKEPKRQINPYYMYTIAQGSKDTKLSRGLECPAKP